MSTYLTVLQQVEEEIRSRIQKLKIEQRNLQLKMDDPKQWALYLCIWEDKLSLISETDLPEGLSWADYERAVLTENRTEIHALVSEQKEAMEQQQNQLETQLQAWRFAYSMVQSYREPEESDTNS